MDTKLEFLYYATISPGEAVSRHSHSCHELVCYITGTGRTTVGNSVYSYSPGKFSLMLPGCTHDQSHDTETAVIFIGFDPGSIIGLPGSGLYADTADNGTLHILKEMKRELLAKQPHYSLRLDCLLTMLLISLARQNHTVAEASGGFEYIKEYFRENCAQKIDKMTAAELSGYSYHRFRYLFKKDTGLSPHSYVINQRIEKAKQLLCADRMTVAAVAAECGFYDHSQFCVFFRKSEGISPAEYRKKHSRTENI